MNRVRTKTVAVLIGMMMPLIGFLIFGPSASAQAPKPTEEPIILGYLGPLKFVHGSAGDRAARLAIEEINASGGVNVAGKRHPFKLESADCRSTEPGTPVSETLLVVEKLILDNKVKFIISAPTRSEATLAAMDIFSKYKIVTICSTGTLTPELHKRIAQNYDKYKYVFRESGDVVWMMKEYAEFFGQLQKTYHLNKMYIIVQDVAYARAAGDIMASTLEKQGWTIVGKDRTPTGTSDFSVPLNKARDGGAQVLFMWYDAPDVLTAMKQLYELKIPAIPIGFLVYAEPIETWKETQGKVEYAITHTVNAGTAFANFNPWIVRYQNAYKNKYGTEPEAYSVQAPYTACYVLKDAIERAGSLDPDKVVKALEETDLKGTPQGRIRFDPKSHQIVNSMDPDEGAVGTIFQWQAGKRVVVFPPKLALGKVQIPPWMKK
jgi:branched-chain amino acid transport system substrate-binding protein